MGRPLKPDGERVRDIAPTGVRLPPELRDGLLREATLNGRSLSQEITVRLRDSLGTNPSRGNAGLQANDTQPGYVSSGTGLTDSQRMLISVFDTMAPDKQLALLTLLRR